MPKIPYAQEGEEASEATPVYKNLKKLFGMVPNVVKIIGHSGPATQAMGGLLDVYFNKLALPTRLREIAYLTVARANGCSYCQAHHVPMGKAAGLSEDQIALLGPEGFDDPKLPEEERIVVRFAHETTKHVAAAESTIEELKKHYSSREIAELAFVVAAANFIQRIGKNLGVELESAPTK